MSRQFAVAGADGRPLRVTDDGAGRTILLVHGGSNGPKDWRRVARRLAGQFRVLRWPRFTYRSSPPPETDRAMAAEVQEVLAVANAVPEPAVAVGHSSGAVVVLESALAEPSAFAGVLLYEPPLAVTEPVGGDALRRAQRALAADDTNRAVAIFLREIVQVPGLVVRAVKLLRPVWRRLREYAPAQLADTAAIDSLGTGIQRYADLHVPALLLRGGLLSPSGARAGVEALADVLPCVDSRVKLRLHGHGAHYSAPGKLARIIADFADRVHRA